MFKSIFAKQFAAYMGTFVICFGLLGVILISLIQNIFINQKKQELVDQCGNIETALQNYYSIGTNNPMQNIFGGQLASELETLYKYTGNLFVVAKEDDNDPSQRSYVAYTTDLLNQYHSDMTQSDFETFMNNALNSSSLDRVFNGGELVFEGTIGGIFKENTLTVCYPIKSKSVLLSDGSESQTAVLAAIFINAPLTEINHITHDFMTMTIICLLIAAFISFILVYLSSRTISKPIQKITETAKIIANGNFDKRISVKSRDEIGQLAESFNYMAENLNNQEVQRREFIANISHDLRSPLTSIKGFAQAILDGTAPEDKRDRYLNIIMDETERVSKLANDILEISRIQNMDMELDLTDFDINELICQTAVLLEPRVTSKNIQMTLNVPDEKTYVRADKNKIQRVIYNLIDNAVKFTGCDGAIIIETSAAAPSDIPVPEGKIRISVRDNGKGIGAEDQKRVFDRFYKADLSRGEDKKGSGLGLSIVREFIKAHGESIEIASEIDKGSEFSFTLPLSSAR